MIRSDAWDGETGTHALTLKVELMHEAEKQGRQHHFLPLSRSPPAHVGAAPSATPYPTVGPRQQGTPNPARRRPLLAPPRRQSLDPPSGHANRAPRIPLGAGPCWRHPAGKALIHRRATPTGRPESRPAPAHVGATPPATPYPTVGPRQQGVLFPRRAPLPGEPARSPKGPFFPAGLPLFPVGPLPAGSSAATFKSKFSRDNRYKK